MIDKIRKMYEYSDKTNNNQYFKKPSADIWNLRDFKGYKNEANKKYLIGFQYKRRYSKKFEDEIKKNWENILILMDYTFQIKNEDLIDYIWYLFYLPKRLLILWIARLNVVDKNDKWWLLLVREWKTYFFEILRCNGIKNWLKIFINENNEDGYLALNVDDNFIGIK